MKLKKNVKNKNRDNSKKDENDYETSKKLMYYEAQFMTYSSAYQKS